MIDRRALVKFFNSVLLVFSFIVLLYSLLFLFRFIISFNYKFVIYLFILCIVFDSDYYSKTLQSITVTKGCYRGRGGQTNRLKTEGAKIMSYKTFK